MRLYGCIEEKGYVIEAYLPNKEEEPYQFYLKAMKDGKLVKEISFPIFYPIRFGVDMEDLSTLEQKTEELLKELP